MTKKELEKQAAEYGYSVEQIKEFRKHIKPFLRYAIDELQIEYKKSGYVRSLCGLLTDYLRLKNLPKKTGFPSYLEERLVSAKPKDAGYPFWYPRFNDKGLQKRIGFCKLQLKIVKP